MTPKKIFSIAHMESAANASHADTFYHLVKNSSQQFKDEIHDVYFGKNFVYEYEGKRKIYGNPMGVEATDAQVDALFRLQEECGIEISLTVNSIETPSEFFQDQKLLEQFAAFVKSYYDRGLRSCTIGSPHIMRCGILQANCPEMRWKNTVNHRVANAQQVLDYVFCGYDTVVLDRSLCRNFNELKAIRRAVDYYNRTYKPAKKVLLSLLAVEGCLYSCPFKKEHDAMGETISGMYFKSYKQLSSDLWCGNLTEDTWSSKLTCDNWRFNGLYGVLPRNGIDLIIADKDTYNEVTRWVDILKFSGRFIAYDFQPGEIGDRKACWKFTSRLIAKDFSTMDETVYADNITEAINDNLLPLSLWRFTFGEPEKEEYSYKAKLKMLREMPNFWRTDKGRRLVKILRNCRSQCWECHECEKTMGLPSFDSALQLRSQIVAPES